MNDVTTINAQAMALIQVALGPANNPFFATNTPDYYMQYRTAGFTVPDKMVDYTLFRDVLTDPDCVARIIVPNIDGWATMRDTFTHELGREPKFRVHNSDGHVIDAYIHGSKPHLKLAKTLGIDPSQRDVIKLSPITFMVEGVTKDVPRGFSFEGQAERNGFVVKQLMAKYLGKVEFFSHIAHSIEHDREAIPLLDRTDERVPLDVVVIYEARRFFDKVRRNKFYTWLATQAHSKTKIILIN